MSTRSVIIAAINQRFHAIYCHYDGYPEHNGRILSDHYNTQEKVEALIALGDLSSLAPSIEQPEGHSFDSPKRGYTVAYGRDRGETDIEAVTGITIKDTLHRFGDRGQEYTYIWNGQNWDLWNGEEFEAPANAEVELKELLKSNSPWGSWS
ncbi:hypothetical protein LJC19_04880 [Oxalobacter sp. OttesenSCG-928-P03]|nr:hypothetical protein [Oxalobacter sp. OttesenSCG-928-P03]